MEKDALLKLRDIAQFSFNEWHAGLNALLNTHEHFTEYVDRNYRVLEYEVNRKFFMTSNERYFHLIGFMDAIIWLHRTNFFSPTNIDDDLEFIPKNDLEKSIHESAIKRKKAIHQFIISFETGE